MTKPLYESEEWKAGVQKLREDMTYTPEECITARELREMHVPVPGNIPDCAWVRRSSVQFGDVAVTQEGDDSFSFACRVAFTEPFKWVEANIHLEKKEGT